MVQGTVEKKVLVLSSKGAFTHCTWLSLSSRLPIFPSCVQVLALWFLKVFSFHIPKTVTMVHALERSEEFPEGLHLSQNKQHFLQTTGKFGDLSSRCIYNTVIPELWETRFSLSRHGWLLLFSSKNGCSFLFFLNLFSRARIDIPLIDVEKLLRPVFDVSTPPTSPDCVVFAISCNDFGIEIRTRRRRESTWKSNSFEYHGVSGHVVNTVFVRGIWYCLHERGSFSTFDAINNCWRFLGLPEGMYKQCSQVNLLSYY